MSRRRRRRRRLRTDIDASVGAPAGVDRAWYRVVAGLPSPRQSAEAPLERNSWRFATSEPGTRRDNRSRSGRNGKNTGEFFFLIRSRGLLGPLSTSSAAFGAVRASPPDSRTAPAEIARSLSRFSRARRSSPGPACARRRAPPRRASARRARKPAAAIGESDRRTRRVHRHAHHRVPAEACARGTSSPPRVSAPPTHRRPRRRREGAAGPAAEGRPESRAG